MHITRVILDLLHYLFERRRRVYPTLADAVQLTGTTTTWLLGSDTQIVPASTITSNFRIREIVVESVSASIECELVLYSGTTPTEIGRYRFTGAGRIPVATETILANTRISAKLANKGTTARTADVSLGYILETS